MEWRMGQREAPGHFSQSLCFWLWLWQLLCLLCGRTSCTGLQVHGRSPPGRPYQSSRHLSGDGPSPATAPPPCVFWPNHGAGSSFLFSLIPRSLPFPLVFQVFQHPPKGSSLEIPSLNSWQALSLSDWLLADHLCLKPGSIKHEKSNCG